MACCSFLPLVRLRCSGAAALLGAAALFGAVPSGAEAGGLLEDSAVMTVGEGGAPTSGMSLPMAADAAAGFGVGTVMLSDSWSLGPYMLRLADGRLLLAFSRPDGLLGAHAPFVQESANGGSTWSAPVRVVSSSDGVIRAAGGMAQLPNGDVLMSYRHGNLTGGDPVQPDTSYIRIARRAAGSEVWQPWGVVHQSTFVGLWESGLTLLPSGKLLCHFASEEQRPSYPNALFQSESLDGGVTWSDRKRITGIAGSRDGVPSVMRLPSGRLMCFFEAQDWWNLGTLPTDFFIASIYSDDDGMTWSSERRTVSLPTSSQSHHRHTSPQAALMPNGKAIITFYSSEGYAPYPADRYVDICYVEADAPYTSWTLSRKLIGEPAESDRWAFLLPESSTTFKLAYTKNVWGDHQTLELMTGVYTPAISDSFAGRIALAGTTGSYNASTSDATREAGEPDHAGHSGGKSAWWAFTPPYSGTFHLTTAGSNFDTLLAVYTGASPGALTPVAVNNDSGPGTLTSAATFSVAAGVPYSIAVDGAGGRSGFLSLKWSLCQAAPPAPTLVTPAAGAVLHQIPAMLDWQDIPGTLSYDVILDGAVIANTTQSHWHLVSPMGAGPHTWRIRAINACGAAASPVRTFTTFDLRLDSAAFSPSAPAALAPGQLLDCSWTVSGPSTGAVPVWFEMFASRSGGFGVERFGGTVTSSFPAVHGGGAVTYKPGNQTVTNIPDGVYTLIATVNRPAIGGPGETNPFNNFKALAGKRIYVRNTSPRVSDLTWSAAPSIAVTGPRAVVSGQVVNSGVGPSPAYGFWIESVYGRLSPEGELQIHGYVGNGVKVTRSLAQGETFSYSASGTLPPGQWVVAAHVDSTDLVPELFETNNYSMNAAAPPSTGPVDLEVLSADVHPVHWAPAEMQAGQTLEWSCTVRNNSASGSGQVWFELFASQTGGLDVIRAGTTLTQSDRQSVPAGQTRTFTIRKPLNALSDGIYTPVAVVNRRGLGDVLDPVPGNNRRVINSRVLIHNTLPQLANLTWESGPAVTRGAGTITVSGAIRNAGSQQSGPFWTELHDGFFDGTGIYVKEKTFAGVHNPGLAAGAVWNYSVTTGYLPTDSVLGVLTDSTDIVPEADETDNYDYLQP